MEKEKNFLKYTLQKDVYTKKEVKDLLEDYGKICRNISREETLNEVQSNISDMLNRVDNNYYFIINPDIIVPDHKDSFRTNLFHYLNKGGFFKGEVKEKDFKRVFSGDEAKKGEPITKITWRKNIVGIYLLYSLWDKYVIAKSKFYEKAELFFGIKAATARNYWSIIDRDKFEGTPPERKSIDQCVKDALSAVNIKLVT